jgi:transcriptional regulator, PadR family
VISKFGFQRLKRGALKYLVLECLNEKPMRTYEIIKSIEKKFEGSYRPSTGSIYPVLKGLVEKDLVEVKVENGKKIYIITDKGKKNWKRSRTNHLNFLAIMPNSQGKYCKNYYKLHFICIITDQK